VAGACEAIGLRYENAVTRKGTKGRRQTSFVFRTWGGARKGAGRKRRSKATVPHVKRPSHSKHHPLHVTLRVVDGLPSLRKALLFCAIKGAFLKSNTKSKHRDHFRLTHFSVQGNHLHLVTEASDATRLARGVQGLAVRIAKRLNSALQRRGRVFAERYHARPLRSPREVRHALAYVLLNEQRHLAAERGLSLSPWYFDPCSSATEFDGWRKIHGLPAPPQPKREVTAPPQSYLLRVLWRRHGLIASYEVPGAWAATVRDVAPRAITRPADSS
jgi:hypothetical protein